MRHRLCVSGTSFCFWCVIETQRKLLRAHTLVRVPSGRDRRWTWCPGFPNCCARPSGVCKFAWQTWTSRSPSTPCSTTRWRIYWQRGEPAHEATHLSALPTLSDDQAPDAEVQALRWADVRDELDRISDGLALDWIPEEMERKTCDCGLGRQHLVDAL